MIPQSQLSKNLWIIKPLEGEKDVFLFSNFKDIENFIYNRPVKTQWLIQKYIENPLLYNGRKFDIKIWCLITDKNEVYIYKNSYFKTSSYTYNMTNIDNLVIHSTNTKIQKLGDFSRYEEGNTVSLDIIDEFLFTFFTEMKLETHILPRIYDIVIDIFQSIRNKINYRHRRNCFELLTFDFIIDKDFRLWLLDIHNKLDMSGYCKYMKNILPKLIEEILSLTVDLTFPPIVENYNLGLKENYFELIYSEHGGKKSKRRNYDKKNYYPFEKLIPHNPLKSSSLDKNDKIISSKYTQLYQIYEVFITI